MARLGAISPTLSQLGIACAIGLFWSLAATIFFTLPAAVAIKPKLSQEHLELEHGQAVVLLFLLASFVDGMKAEKLLTTDVKTLLERIREKAPLRRACKPFSRNNEKSIYSMSRSTAAAQSWFQAPNKFRVKRKGNAPSLTVSNGKQL